MNTLKKLLPYLAAILKANDLETAQREARLAKKIIEKETGK